MWIHGVWLAVVVLAAWIAYRIGVAVESGRVDEEFDDMERDLYTERQRATIEREMAATRYGALEARYYGFVDRAMAVPFSLSPVPTESVGDPLTVAQADRLAVEELRKARARESRADGHATESTEGMELLGVTDGEALPVPHLEESEERG